MPKTAIKNSSSNTINPEGASNGVARGSYRSVEFEVTYSENEGTFGNHQRPFARGMISESSQHVLFRRPRMLTFITTYKCGAVCDHCLMSCTRTTVTGLLFPKCGNSSIASPKYASEVVLLCLRGGECLLLAMTFSRPSHMRIL